MSSNPTFKDMANLDPIDVSVYPPAQTVELPSPNTKRWVIRRKAAVVDAVKSGMLTLEQACERYKLSTEEFFTWQTLVEQHGVPGLRVTRLQSYRAGERR